MAAPTNHWKLGLFVVVGVVLALTTITFLGAESLKKKVVSYQTDFDESVQGLEVGSPVKFRGVTVGTVSAIGIAPDRRHVVVTSELAIVDLTELGLVVGKGDKSKIRVPADLRMQIASQGITGVKFLQIDFFDVKDNPPPVLPFPVPENYIPAAESTMKNLEDAVVRAVDRIPEIADGIVVILGKVNRLLDDMQGGKLMESAASTLARANQVLASLQAEIHESHVGAVSAKAQEALTALNETIARTNTLLAKLDGDKGLLASAQRASNAVGDVAVNARSLGPELEETLRDVQEFTAAIQRVADALERDPDMLLKGRGKAKGGSPRCIGSSWSERSRRRCWDARSSRRAIRWSSGTSRPKRLARGPARRTPSGLRPSRPMGRRASSFAWEGSTRLRT
jgi:paraquat-inducible protein B